MPEIRSVNAGTNGELVIRTLAANGVEVAFGIPGTHNLELYRGLSASTIRHVSPRHEQGAGYAADGYARSTRRPGVVITTSGPGILNLMAALGTAYADSVPLLVISPGPPTGSERAGMGWLHEVKDQRAAVDAVAARGVRCESSAHLVQEINSTFARWRVERPRPVYLEVPVDVLEAQSTISEVLAYPPLPEQRCDPGAVARAVALLKAAEHPLIVAGGGACEAGREMLAVARLIDAPVVTTVAGKAVVSELNPVSGGVALPYAADQLSFADVVLIVGSEMADVDWPPNTLAATTQIIRIDLSAEQRHKPIPAHIPLLGAAHPVLTPRLDLIPPAAPSISRASAAAHCIRAALHDGARPLWRAFHESLAAVLPPETIVTGDSSQISYLGTAPTLTQTAPRRFLYPNGFATLGYALPAAIGARLGCPDTPVLGLLGDGALMFSVQELVTAAQTGIALTLVVVENDGYAEIREQMAARKIPPVGVDLLAPDLVSIARACHWTADRASGIDHLLESVNTSLRSSRSPHVVFINQRTIEQELGLFAGSL